MEHKSLDELGSVATLVSFTEPKKELSRKEKLNQWAEALERDKDKLLLPLMRVEFMPVEERMALRGDNTPLATAFGDEKLREAGLANDSFGEAIRFFELSDYEAHHLLCDCHYHGAMSAESVAARARAIANWPDAGIALGRF